MATFKSNLATTQTQNGDNRVDGRLLAGKVRQCNATITVAGTEATSDVIEVVTLPTGALINLAESYIVTEALGTTFTVGVESFKAGGYISEHDAKIAKKLAYVVCGGDLSAPTKVSEQYLLDLEREAFLSLCTEKKSLERIQHMLQTGKPLRN